MKAQELRQETSERLLELLREKRQVLLDYRVKSRTSHDLNPKDYRTDRKDVARILTILTERGIRPDRPAAKAEEKE